MDLMTFKQSIKMFGRLRNYTSGSIKVSGQLPTYPSPRLTLILTSHFEQNDGLGKG